MWPWRKKKKSAPERPPVTVDGVGVFAADDKDFLECNSPVTGLFRCLTIYIDEQDDYSKQQLELIKSIAPSFENTVSLALVYLKNDKGFLEDHEIYGELEYESVTVLPDDHENDYSLSFQFSKWDDGWVEVEFKNGKPVQHSVND